MDKRRVLGGKGRGLEPRPGGNNSINTVDNILQPRPFSPGSIRGLGDFHNVLAPTFPIDPDNLESKSVPTLREPIRESFPSGLEHILVAVDDNNVLAPGRKRPEAEAEQRKVLPRRVLSICPLILPQQRGW